MSGLGVGFSSWSLHSITITEGTEDTISSLLFTPSGAWEWGGRISFTFYSCSVTWTCTKILPFKIENVDFWAPPFLSVLLATTLGNPSAGIPLRSIAKHNGDHVNVQSFSFSLYFRNSVSPWVSEASESTFPVSEFPQYSALAAWESLHQQQQCLFCAVQNVSNLSFLRGIKMATGITCSRMRGSRMKKLGSFFSFMGLRRSRGRDRSVLSPWKLPGDTKCTRMSSLLGRSFRPQRPSAQTSPAEPLASQRSLARGGIPPCLSSECWKRLA